MKKPTIKTLHNGLTVVCVPSASPSVTVSILVSTGSRYEQASNNGISHFLEHLCFKGTCKKTGKEIMRYLDGLGSETNAFTNYELTGYYVKSITKHWKKTLAVVTDIYLNSTFPDIEMQKEKGVIMGEIDMYEDMPTSQVQQLISSLVFGDQPLGWPIIGPKKNIRNMSREDIVNYHTSQYRASATTVVIAGNVDEKEILSEVQRSFENIPEGKKQNALKIIHKKPLSPVSIKKRSTDQTHVIVAYPSYGYHHKDVRVLSVIASLLGGGMSSRLFETLREDMGVGYYVNAYQNSFNDVGMFEISCGIDSNRLQEVVPVLLKELEKLQNTLVSESELKKNQEYMIGNFLMSLEGTDSLGYFYGKRSAFGLETKSPRELSKEIKLVSSRDIKRVARKIFTRANIRIALVGPHGTDTEKQLKNIIKKENPSSC